MIPNGLAALYLIIGFPIGWTCAGHALYDEHEVPKAGDKAFAFFAWLFCWLLWPLVVGIWTWGRYSELLVRTPPKIRKQRKADERQRIQRAAREAEHEQRRRERELAVGEENGGGLAVIEPPRRSGPRGPDGVVGPRGVYEPGYPGDFEEGGL